jgi:hypothetical protein
MAIAREEALRLAESHAKGCFKNPEYQTWHEYSGRVANGWLFSYRYRYLKEVPPGEEFRYALVGAGGFIVSSEGVVRDLSVPQYHEAEQNRVQE